MMTEDQEAKLRCLELAAKFADRTSQSVVLDTAEKFWSFIRAADPDWIDWPAAEQRFRDLAHDEAVKVLRTGSPEGSGQ
jgi:hypothetical protein